MTRRQDDDADDQEAQRKRRFLEQGAQVRLDRIQRFPAAGPRLTPPRPVTVALPETQDLAAQLAADPDTEAVLTLDLGELTEAPNYLLLAFINTPNARADTPTTEPGFVGTVAFFLDDEHGAHGEGAVRAQLPARQAIERSVTGRGALTLTLVPIGVADREASGQPLEVTATVELARSEIELGS